VIVLWLLLLLLLLLGAQLVNCHYAAINDATSPWQWQLRRRRAPRSIELGEYFKSISDIPAPLRATRQPSAVAARMRCWLR